MLKGEVGYYTSVLSVVITKENGSGWQKVYYVEVSMFKCKAEAELRSRVWREQNFFLLV